MHWQIEVLLPLPLATCFSYIVEAQLANTPPQVGQRVLVPFANTTRVGLIMAVKTVDTDETLNPISTRVSTDKTESSTSLKSAIALCEPFAIVNVDWLALLKFASRYYAKPIGAAFSHAFPVFMRDEKPLSRPLTRYLLSNQQTRVAYENSKQGKPKQLLEFVLENSPCSLDTLKQHFSSSVIHAAIKKAENNGEKAAIDVISQSPFCEQTAITPPDYALNAEQKAVVDAVDISANAGFKSHLLFGVTGSGKTEVYLQLIEKTLAQQKDAQILLLIPEIALTPQMVARFASRFGKRVVAYHSGLSQKQRQSVFIAASQGDVPIVIGTRSAIFLPFAKLALLIVDEEHDLSYKQHESFFYHARDLAIWRAKNCNIPVLLGSATPSLESLLNVQKGRYYLHQLSARATGAALPKLTLIDCRGEKRPLLDYQVIQKIHQTLQNGKQVLLFLNRRGFAPVMRCDACGWESRCPHCSVYQVAHLQSRTLCCHHCGAQSRLPTHCPVCGAHQLYFVGKGTERLEAFLNQHFPKHQVLRLDRDKQHNNTHLHAALKQIESGEAELIVGTQLLVKGHHFPNVTLVCVVDADGALFSSDFRSEEHLFQQLTQVAGRAGREETAGEVIVQTSVPNHPLFQALKQHDYLQYAKQLLDLRAAYGLPPYQAQAELRASHSNQAKLHDFLLKLKTQLETDCPDLIVLGPAPQVIERVAKRFQMFLWIGAKDKRMLQHYLPTINALLTTHDKSQKFMSRLDVDAM